MFRASSEQKMLALVGSDPTNVDVARHKDWRFELNGHSTPKGVQNFKLVKAINIPLLRSEDDVKYRVGFVVLFGALQ